MNSTQHAGKILHAWKHSDRRDFETALDSALICCSAKREVSRLEFERREILESVVQHFRKFGNSDSFAQSPFSKGALTLLSHLSSNSSPFGVSSSENANPRREKLEVRH